MFKFITSFFSILLLSASFVYGMQQQMPQMGPPFRMDLVDSHSKCAGLKLARAEKILATLVPDPGNYQLILSSRPSLGGEAVPPFVFADKPTMIVYQGTLSPDRSNEEIAFVMAHELGHLNLYHNEKMHERMEKIFTGPPIGISGTIFSIFHQKLQEREADQFGLHLYRKAGYDLNFFPATLKLIQINPNIHYGTNQPFKKTLTSLSMKDSHFSMQERFTLLTQESQVI